MARRERSKLCVSPINLQKLPGGSSCWGDNRSRLCLLEKAFYLGRELPKFCARQKPFVFWLQFHASTVFLRANCNPTISRCLSSSIPATILTPRSNKSNF